MEFATGALGTLLPKLGQLLQDEYKLHKGTKKNIEFLTRELKSVHAALHNVGEVLREDLNEKVRVWAREARVVSYDMEDIVDTFLVRVQDPHQPPSKRSAKKFIKKMMGFVTKAKTRHDIGQEIKDIKERVKEIAERRDRNKVDVAIRAKTSIDPCIAALYNKVSDLVGVDEPSKELIMTLTKDDDKSAQQRVVSVVGFGGLGKTTLAKAVYEKLKGQFDCTAFVPVGRNPDLKKVLKAISVHLGMHLNLEILDDGQLLIDKLREFVENKREPVARFISPFSNSGVLGSPSSNSARHTAHVGSLHFSTFRYRHTTAGDDDACCSTRCVRRAHLHADAHLLILLRLNECGDF